MAKYKNIFNDDELLDGRFFNPFLMDKDEAAEEETEPVLKSTPEEEEQDIHFFGFKPWNTNVTNKIKADPEHMRAYAGRSFHKGDTLETLAVEIVPEEDLYSSSIRKMAFELDPVKRIYGMVVGGYLSYCRTSGNSNMKGNIDYRYNPRRGKSGLIEVYAIRNIKKGDELIFLADETEYVNALKPYMFQYDRNAQSLYNADIHGITKSGEKVKGIHESVEEVNELEVEDIDVNSYKPKTELNQTLWDGDILKDDVKQTLLDIASDFCEELTGLSVEPSDIVFTGSLANYNWSDYSDIDLHILYPYSRLEGDEEFLDDYFYSKKELWNKMHRELSIYGFPVEVYVENADLNKDNNGRYSLMTDGWLTEPSNMDDVDFDEDYIKSTAIEFANAIDDLEYKVEEHSDDKQVMRDVNDELTRLYRKLKDLRQRGLQSEKRDLSNANIAYKTLRNNGYIQKIFDISNKAYDRAESLNLEKINI